MENSLTESAPRRSTASPFFYIDTHFEILHEDDDYLVVDKPAPLAVYPIGAYAELNLHSLLKKDSRWTETKLHFTHRLDAETSGVILIAKTHEAARFAGIEFLNGRVRKKYKALVFGAPEKPEGEIDLPLGKDTSSGFQTIRIVDHAAGEKALTRYRLLWTRGGYSYLEIEPVTGRTHQIRAHLSFIGHPIVGDKIYVDTQIFVKYVKKGLDEEMLSRLKLPRLALHAEDLSIRHPRIKEEVSFHSEPPDFFGEIKW